MLTRKKWRQMSLRHRILFLLVGYLAVTVPLALVLYAVTDQASQYLHWWTGVFWTGVFLAGLQEIYIYGRPLEHGRLSGTILLIIVAYLPMTKIHSAYNVLFPDGAVGIALNFAFVSFLILAGGHVGRRSSVLQQIDEWFYRDLLDELRRMHR